MLWEALYAAVLFVLTIKSDLGLVKFSMVD